MPSTRRPEALDGLPIVLPARPTHRDCGGRIRPAAYGLPATCDACAADPVPDSDILPPEALTARARHLVLCPAPSECANHPEQLTPAEWDTVRPVWGRGSWPNTARTTTEAARLAHYGRPTHWVATARPDVWGGPMYCGSGPLHHHPTEAAAFDCALTKSNPAEWTTCPVWPSTTTGGPTRGLGGLDG